VQFERDRTVLDEISDGSEFVISAKTASLARLLKRFLSRTIASQRLVKHLSGGDAAFAARAI